MARIPPARLLALLVLLLFGSAIGPSVVPLDGDGKLLERDERVKQIVIELCPNPQSDTTPEAATPSMTKTSSPSPLLPFIITSRKQAQQQQQPSLNSVIAAAHQQAAHPQHQKQANSGYSGYILNLLLRKVFMNYNKEAIPLRPVIVHLDVLLLKVKNTVEKEGIFECVIALFIEWHDFRMVWDPREYDNLSVLAFDSDKVWLPDIAMTNSADHLYSISRDSRFVVRVSNTGLFKFVPTGTARTWCDLNLLTFPFDYQKCSMEFESWSLDSSIMTFDNQSQLLVDDSFASNQFFLCEQKVMRYDHTYEFTGETFTRLKFDFKVRRKSAFYIINLIFPCTTLSAIQLLVFLISSTDTTADRIGFGTTNLLTLVVFQTIVTEEMPKTSDAVTTLSKYIIALILISAVCIFESVIVERMFAETSEAPPPKYLQHLLQKVPILGQGKHHLKLSSKNFRKASNNSGWNDDRRRRHGHASVTRPNTITVPISRLMSVASQHKNGTLPQNGDVNAAHSNEGCNLLDEKPPSADNISSSGCLSIQIRIASLNPDGGLGHFVATANFDNLISLDDQERLNKVDICGDEEEEQDSEEMQVFRNNARLWALTALKIDFIAFVTCLVSAIGVPSMLFFPLLDFQHACSEDPAVNRLASEGESS